MMLEIRSKHFSYQDYLAFLNAVSGRGGHKAGITSLQKNWIFYVLKVLGILLCGWKKDLTMDFKRQKDKSGSWFPKDFVHLLSSVLIHKSSPILREIWRPRRETAWGHQVS